MSRFDDLTLGDVRELMGLFSGQHNEPRHPFTIGKIYLIRTVTMIQTGRLVDVTPTELVLEDAAWIADTGRFSEALVSLNFLEQEPFPDGKVIVGRGALIDAVEIKAVQRTLK